MAMLVNRWWYTLDTLLQFNGQDWGFARNRMSYVLKRLISLRLRFMTLVHLWVIMFHVKFSEKSVGKVNPLRTSCMSAFSRFSLFWSYKTPKGNLNRNMANCSMGPGGFVTCINPKWNPNRRKVNSSNGLIVAGSALRVCPLGKPLVLWVTLLSNLTNWTN